MKYQLFTAPELDIYELEILRRIKGKYESN